jgi:hypothetical protein
VLKDEMEVKATQKIQSDMVKDMKVELKVEMKVMVKEALATRYL